MSRSPLAILSVIVVAACVAPPPPPAATYPARLAPEPVAYAGPIRNPMVRDIQRQLRRHGYYPGATNGIDSPETAQAIAAFQAAHRLRPDGVASPYLLSVLRNTPPGS